MINSVFIRKFDLSNNEELFTLQFIANHQNTCHHMPGPKMAFAEIQEWASTEELWCVTNDQDKCIGFINIYEPHKSLLSRIINQNSDFKPSKTILEISYALDPNRDYPTGTFTKTLKLTHQFISQKFPDTNIIAITEKSTNPRSAFGLENAGFKQLSNPIKYHGNSKKLSEVYFLNLSSP